MAEREQKKDPIPRIYTADQVAESDVRTAEEEVADTDTLLTTVTAAEAVRLRAERRVGGAAEEEAQPEDEEVNPVGSYESWDQTGQGLDAAGSGMTGDSGSVGLTGTGFEDDTDV